MPMQTLRHSLRAATQSGKKIAPQGRHPRRVLTGVARGIRLPLDLESQSQTWVGLYEIELNRHLARLCRPGGLCIDVGGGLGYHALVLARLSQGPVTTFEPSERARAVLQQALDLNPDLAKHVTVSDQPVGGDGGVSLDAWVSTHGLEPTFLKVDVDGFEMDVLESAEEVLRQHKPAVIVETHTPELEVRCGRKLRELGYQVLIVSQRRVLREHRPPLQHLGADHNRWLVAEPVAS